MRLKIRNGIVTEQLFTPVLEENRMDIGRGIMSELNPKFRRSISGDRGKSHEEC